MRLVKYTLIMIGVFCFSLYSSALVPIDTSKEKYNVEQIAQIELKANQGNADAQNELGYMYATGQGVTQNISKAIEFYIKSVDQGNADAQNNLGIMYATGQGVTQNASKAIDLFNKAIQQGNADSLFHLGYMYATGQGTKKNNSKGKKYLKKACLQQINEGCIYYHLFYDQK